MASKTITLYEHQDLKYTQISVCLPEKQSLEQTLNEIDALNRAAGHDILTLKRDRLSTTSWIGLVSAGSLLIQILPKIDIHPELTRNDAGLPHPSRKSQKKESEVYSAIDNLLQMLCYAYAIPIDQQQITLLQEQEANWFELLALFFASQLIEQTATGLMQEYVNKEGIEPSLHGRWDIQHQLRDAGTSLHQFYIQYQERSLDTPLNQVFKYVLDRILLLTTQAQIKNLLLVINTAYDQVTLLSSIPADFLSSIHFNRLNERFAPAFSLACLFLAGKFIQPNPGRQQSPAFVLNMDILYERFITGFLEIHRQEIFRCVDPMIKITPQGKERDHYLATQSGKMKIRLIPDLLLTQEGSSTPVMVVDMKYKRIDAAGKGVLAEDVYQMVAYAVSLGCRELMLIYPQLSRTAPIRQIYEIPALNARIYINTVNLHIPLRRKEIFLTELKEIFCQALAPNQG
jgi:5-methylcytosine-specific restriction enzyme subunit McrC